MNAPPVLALRAVHKRFGRQPVIDGVDLTLRPGERMALIGPNGAGKSTLFNLISGLLRPTQGSIWLHGQRIDGWAPERIRRAGLARGFQISQGFANLSVADNLRCAVLGTLPVRQAWWRPLRGVPQVQARVDALLHALNLYPHRARAAAELPYAEQRALELGLTLAGDAPLVLLDEPTAGMSRAETAHAIALIRRLSAGRTLLMVEHDMQVVFELADRVAVLVGGRVLACDTPARVRADARVQAAYLGEGDLSGDAPRSPTPATNAVPATAASDEGAPC